ncbi:hypothetical protein [Massilia sp. CCM 8734]|uniref:hypothetical protein n=1 Tax=Massilia sp. CCM 8734 TaxID=2609283 RepID=UPI00141F39A7|nr:hypothetical protein [Massilia sp. CCM 8734]NHZ98031.1 hypothetical protein [Massilia sp. CCM 8734]
MEWRTHPALSGKFHPDYPDDIQVIIHDGGPRITTLNPEAAWVTVTGVDGDVFSGRLIITPTQVTSVRLNQSIRFIATSNNHPVMVSDKYLEERPSWLIGACHKCGFDELLDAPSDLIKVVFPNIPADAEMEEFTAFCGACGGAQIVEARPAPKAAAPLADAAQAAASERPWWKRWG